MSVFYVTAMLTWNLNLFNTFVLCFAGSCLSYGHSCWGGKAVSASTYRTQRSLLALRSATVVRLHLITQCQINDIYIDILDVALWRCVKLPAFRMITMPPSSGLSPTIGLLEPEDGDTKTLRNVDTYLSNKDGNSSGDCNVQKHRT